MSNHPIISVIIPIYNREKFIENTLQNVLNNKYRPLELLLINDGSTDNSLNILNDFKKKYENEDFQVKVYSQRNSGAPAARNKGLREVTGKYVQFLDSDDLLTTDKFTNDIRKIKETNADIVVSDFEKIFIDEDDKKMYFDNSSPLSKVIVGKSISITALIDEKLARSISWNESLKKNQDMDYFGKIIIIAKNIAYIPKAQYLYLRYKGDNITSNYSRIKSTSIIRLRNLIYVTVMQQRYNNNPKVYINLAKLVFNFFLNKL